MTKKFDAKISDSGNKYERETKKSHICCALSELKLGILQGAGVQFKIEEPELW